ncbi:LacI family DNA-binding transcriptional regulator [Actinoplanes sp. Pm04-4]|uniref:LacI family DNA-binding transcriptional regulator n=1 Tax=Paractinoplanes pyxinae TaxID=2997416 RepID=A0ABT4BG61_9ACTN|nr:LacI family DNA-binding transcriptional regulator [Actinoplanes pyxinae]MCY1145441.1 LacI family DNA-binding transcriptional regulator [Actinoplanes pyxinae]
MRDERRPTLTDVAERAGVSKSLVSLVMRDEPGAGAETRRRVLEAAGQLGYQPDSRARLLRSGRSRLLGVVFGIQHPFHADLVTGLYTAARETGYELALSAVTADRDEAEAIAGLLQDRCEALILLGPHSSAASLARLSGRMPVVSLARPVRHTGVDVVRSADAEGSGLAVDHLAGLGHTAIAHIDGGRAPGAAERRRGYRAAMDRHGLTGRILPGGLTESEGAAAARALLADPPTAVTVFNDRCATGVLDVLSRNGIAVPDELSMVGYDDSSLARLAHINLTTVAQDVTTMTRSALTRAIARVQNEPITRREIIVPPHLVVRGTTAPPA